MRLLYFFHSFVIAGTPDNRTGRTWRIDALKSDYRDLQTLPHCSHVAMQFLSKRMSGIDQ